MELSNTYLDRALAGYRRIAPAGSPQPSAAHSYETRLVHPHYGEQHYVVLASESGQLVALYRVRRRGMVWLMEKVPGAVRRAHAERIRRQALRAFVS